MTDYLCAELLIDQLAVENVRCLFGKPGSTCLPFMEALEKRQEITYIQAIAEGVAVAAAAGYAQASGKVGVVNVHGTAGITAALAQLVNAYAARTPLVILAGQIDRRMINSAAFFSANVPAMCAPLCKWACEVKVADEFSGALRRAFHESFSPPQGPVVVLIPVDILRQPAASRVIMPPKLAGPSAADSAFLKRAAQILTTASKPAVIVGNEVSQYRARKEAVTLVEVLGCPAFSEAMPTGLNFPSRHPLFAGVLPAFPDQRDQILQGCDVLLAVGVQNRGWLAAGIVPNSTVVVQINVDPLLSGRTMPCHFAASADLAESLAKLRSDIQLAVDNQWLANSKARASQCAAWVESRRQTLLKTLESLETAEEVPVHHLLGVLDCKRPQKSIIVNDTGNLPVEIMTLESGASYCSVSGNAPGYAIAAALGVKQASPDYTVICLTRDLSALSQPQALWTAAHYNLDVKYVIINSQRYGPPANPASATALPASGQVEISDPPVSFLDLAGAMGVPANSITAPAELDEAVDEMLAAPGPYLIDVRTDRLARTGADVTVASKAGPYG